jgi:hypothetical protein
MEDEIKVSVEQGSFLNKEQKQIKQLIMEKLLTDLFETLYANVDKFDDQASADLLIACIIMFSRESIVSFIQGSNLPDSLDIKMRFADGILSTIRKEIEEKLKE